MVTRGQGGQTGLEPESGLGLGEACGPRGSVVRSQVLNFLRHLHLYLKPRARDLRAETWDLKMCFMSAGNLPVSGLPRGWG